MLFGPGVKAVTTAKVVKDKMLVNSKIFTCQAKKFLNRLHKNFRRKGWEIARDRFINFDG